MGDNSVKDQSNAELKHSYLVYGRWKCFLNLLLHILKRGKQEENAFSLFSHSKIVILPRWYVECHCKDLSIGEDISSPHNKVHHHVLSVMGAVAQVPDG